MITTASASLPSSSTQAVHHGQSAARAEQQQRTMDATHSASAAAPTVVDQPDLILPGINEPVIKPPSPEPVAPPAAVKKEPGEVSDDKPALPTDVESSAAPPETKSSAAAAEPPPTLPEPASLTEAKPTAAPQPQTTAVSDTAEPRWRGPLLSTTKGKHVFRSRHLGKVCAITSHCLLTQALKPQKSCFPLLTTVKISLSSTK